MDPASRLRFNRVYTIECNVKVRDICLIYRPNKTKLVRYFKKSHIPDFDWDTNQEDTGETSTSPHISDASAAVEPSPPFRTWSPEYVDYYFMTQDSNGELITSRNMEK
jgi:hypothetical protein